MKLIVAALCTSLSINAGDRSIKILPPPLLLGGGGGPAATEIIIRQRVSFSMQITGGEDEGAQTIDLDAIDMLEALQEHSEKRRKEQYAQERAQMSVWQKFKEFCSCSSDRPR